MKRSILIITATVLLALVVVSPTNAQISNTDCTNAKVWHYQQAMKILLVQDQDYHIKAAQAADALSSTPGACSDWRNMASGASGIAAP